MSFPTSNAVVGYQNTEEKKFSTKNVENEHQIKIHNNM